MSIEETLQQLELAQLPDDLKTQLRTYLAELQKLRKDCADAAALRQAFYVAGERYEAAYRQGQLMELWRSMYEAIRDTTAGTAILQELGYLGARKT